MQTESVNNSVSVEPKGSVYKIRFDDDIIHPSYYRFELQALNLATELDDVVATVNSSGGSLATGIEVVNEILSCKAPVKGVLRSNCHSCGSIIFLACHTHEVGLASSMLLHSGSGGAGGTPTQSIQRAHSYKRQVRELFETVYKGFLTDDELDKMIEEDKEYIFAADEIEERLQRMYKYRDNCTKEYHEGIEDAMWEENNTMISSALDELDIPEEHKAIFNSVRDAVDNILMEEVSPLSAVTSEVVEDGVETLSSEEDEVPLIVNLENVDGAVVGYAEHTLNKGVILSLNEWVTPLDFTLDIAEKEKGKCVELLKSLTGKNYKSQKVVAIQKALNSIVIGLF